MSTPCTDTASGARRARGRVQLGYGWLRLPSARNYQPGNSPRGLSPGEFLKTRPPGGRARTGSAGRPGPSSAARPSGRPRRSARTLPRAAPRTAPPGSGGRPRCRGRPSPPFGRRRSRPAGARRAPPRWRHRGQDQRRAQRGRGQEHVHLGRDARGRVVPVRQHEVDVAALLARSPAGPPEQRWLSPVWRVTFSSARRCSGCSRSKLWTSSACRARQRRLPPPAVPISIARPGRAGSAALRGPHAPRPASARRPRPGSRGRTAPVSRLPRLTRGARYQAPSADLACPR